VELMMASETEQHEEETEFWRGWHDRCRSHHHPREMRQMWRNYFREAFGKDPEEHWFFGSRRFKGWHASAKPGAFNPFVGLMLAKGGGLLPLLVLHLLEKEPGYGNEIMRSIHERTRKRWTSNPGVIYPLLSFMEERGLIEGEWEDETRRTRRIYRITARGLQELVLLKDVMKPQLEEALEILQALSEELYAKETSRQET
jgi:PadR family transcriptional regulator PadR